MVNYRKIGPNLFELTQDYNEGGIRIPEGFKWNGASIPWFLRWLVKPTELTKEGSLVHDMLYSGNNGVTRALADKIFKNKLLEDGVKPLKAWAMWLGVRLGGWLYFKGK